MQSNAKKNKIMVIDDEINNIKSVELALNEREYEIISDTDPKKGLEKIIQEDPDLILLDIMMPKLSGFEVANIIKENEITNAPVIFLTSLSDAKTKKNAYSTGIDDYIVKPFIQEELITKINKKLDTVKRVKESEESWKMLKSIIEDIIPHEISTPLTVVSIGMNDIQEKRKEMKDEIKQFFNFIDTNTPELKDLNFYKYLKKNFSTFTEYEDQMKKMVDTSVKRLERLVKKIVFYNKNFEIKKVNVLLKNKVIEVIKRFQHDIEFSIPEDILLNVDEKLLEEILYILIDNAILHNQGKVEINIKAEKLKDNVKICLEDNGRGINEDKIDKIFKPYFLGHKVLNHSEGIGLGLFFVKKVVEAHNGDISVISKPGEKTIFTITFPFKELD